MCTHTSHELFRICVHFDVLISHLCVIVFAQEPGCKRPYEWNYNNIPLTEQFCNVSVSFVDLDESQDTDHYFTNYTTCSFSG